MELGLRPRRGAQALTRPRGLSGQELGQALAELGPLLQGAQVRSVARVADSDDLLLFCEQGSQRHTLQIALGQARARITTTTRRFARDEFATGPLIDRLAERLTGARCKAFVQPTGERRVSLEFSHPEASRLSLEVELFGNRGLWLLLDASGRILELSRLPNETERKLEPGLPYAPPRSHGAASDLPSRFTTPVLAAIDAHFTELDLAGERDAERVEVERALAAARKRLAHKLAGLTTQQEEIARVPELRRNADLMLAYSFGVKRGQTVLEVPDPEHDGAVLRFELDPAKPIRDQIEALYDRARRLEDATEIAKARAAETARELEGVAVIERELAAAASPDAIAAVRAQLVARGLLRARPGRVTEVRKPTGKQEKHAPGENFRRFVSVEGYTILCGKSNAQNDKLTLRVAAGNDLWFHVGQGYAGSHVVLKLPKGKTASLESLLDAGTIAIHFSKGRAATVCDVDYTFAKFVRKPKGFPPGKVTITQNKTLRVRIEKARLERLLAGTSGDD